MNNLSVIYYEIKLDHLSYLGINTALWDVFLQFLIATSLFIPYFPFIITKIPYLLPCAMLLSYLKCMLVIYFFKKIRITFKKIDVKLFLKAFLRQNPQITEKMYLILSIVSLLLVAIFLLDFEFILVIKGRKLHTFIMSISLSTRLIDSKN